MSVANNIIQIASFGFASEMPFLLTIKFAKRRMPITQALVTWRETALCSKEQKALVCYRSIVKVFVRLFYRLLVALCADGALFAALCSTEFLVIQ